MSKDNVIDYNSLGKGKKKRGTNDEAAEMDEMMSLLTGLPEHMQRMIGNRFTFLMMFTVISARVAEHLKKDGYDPNKFDPEKDSTEAFLRNGPYVSEDDDEEALWNGPMFDCARNDAFYRVATTVELGIGDSFDLTMDLLRREGDDEKWEIYADGEWQPGPPSYYFDILYVQRDDWFNDDDDDDDGWYDNEPPESVYDMDVNRSVISALIDSGIETVEDLCEKTKSELLAIKGIGRKSVEAIEEELDYYGLKLKKE